MVHIRIRVGDRVREFTRTVEQAGDMDGIESISYDLLDIVFNLAGYNMEYMGNRSWDIYVDKHKIGHVKSWEVTHEPKKGDEPTLFQWFLLVLGMFLALC